MTKKLNLIATLLLISVTVMFGSFLLKINNLPPQIPLFYSRGDGEEQMADTFWIFLLPIISLLLVTTNHILRKRYFAGVFLIERIVYYTNITIIIVTTVIFLKILLLVT
ncbi:MAG TPA: hypothetical protein VK338_01000 [Candidatus Nitrosocosmicus sp.]|nr:hypothetical protein [Candidatus Nitrosocosmicus sp.]